MAKHAQYALIVVAGGRGTRCNAASELPKQYLPLLGQPLLAHTLACFAQCTWLSQIVLVVAAGDQAWRECVPAQLTGLKVVEGGATRAASVQAGLAALSGQLSDQDWVLVHDGARPCITPALVASLRDACQDHPVGGLLAVPVTDTLKRAAADQSVAETVPRVDLWRAQTPQMLRYGILQRALVECPTATDEAMAVEQLGESLRLVMGALYNLKVTYAQDLALAAFWLRELAK